MEKVTNPKSVGRIILAGTIGAGKTTISDLLSRETKKIVWQEPVDTNPVIKEYYANPSGGSAYLLQTFFLTDRFNSMIRADKGEILDRSLDESYLFAKINHEEGNFTDVELAIYRKLYEDMYNSVQSVRNLSKDLLVYLDIDYDHVIERVIKRGRDYEQFTDDKKKNKILENHYRLLIDGYKKMYENYKKGPKISLNMNDIDVAASDSDKEYVLKTILDAYHKEQ